MPSISARPPGPANRTVGTMRTIDPSRVTFTCRYVASRPTSAAYEDSWTEPLSALFSTITSRDAPSPTTNSMFAATLIKPRWSMTSVARELAPTSTTWWAYARPLIPLRNNTIGSVSATSGSTRTCRPRFACAMASALTRSAGASAAPNASSVLGSTTSTWAPSGTRSSPSMTPSGSNGSKNSRIRASGVNRQTSWWAFGIAKSSGLREVNRSAGLPVGCSRTVT